MTMTVRAAAKTSSAHSKRTCNRALRCEN
jgi:hypothetical protein